MSAQIRLTVYSVSIATVGFFSLLFVYSPQLSFWWDEFSLIQAHQQFAYGISDSHMGHFFPLGRLAFALYVEVFGSSYFPMILINALVCLVALVLIFLLIRPDGAPSFLTHLLFVIPIVSMLSSAGVLYDIQWAMQVCWFLSILFGVSAVISLNLLRYRYQIFTLLMLLSWLSLSSNIIGVSILVSAIGIWQHKLSIRNVFFTLGAGFCMFFVGYVFATKSHPIDPNAYGIPADLTVIRENLWSIAELTGVLAMSWLLSPVSLLSTSSQNGFYALGTNINSVSHLNLFVIVLLVVLLSICGLRSVEKFRPLSMLLLLGGIIIQSVLIVISRFGFFSDSRSSQLQGFLHVRYAPLLQLLATLFWIFLLITSFHYNKKRLAQAAAFVVSVLLLATTCWALLNLPLSIAESSDFGRISKTNDQLNEFKKCGDPSLVVIYSEIQPSIPGPLMCEITATVSGLND